MSDLVYLVGPPGVGKSTVMSLLTRDCTVQHQATKPFAYDVLLTPEATRAVRLGAIRPDGFSGTDALSMNVQPKVLNWFLSSPPFTLVLGEGDRLGNVKFVEGVLGMGWNVHLICLAATAQELAYRRRARGSNQNPGWMRGRQTKVDNLVEWAMTRLVHGIYPSEQLRVHMLATGPGPWRTAEAIEFLVPRLMTLTHRAAHG